MTENHTDHSDARFQLVAKATSDIIWDWDISTNRVWWSDGVTDILGYPAAEVGPDAAWWYDRIHPDDRGRIVADIQRFIDEGGEHWSAEYRYLKADGTYADIHDRSFSIRDGSGKILRMVGAMHDLTRQKAAEKALKDATDKSRAILESITDTFFAMDREWRFTYVNRQCEIYFGKPSAEVLGKTYWDALGVPRIPEVDAHYRKALEEQVAVHFETFSTFSRRWLELHVFPSEEGISVYFRDITDRKRTEAHRHFLMELNDAVRLIRNPEDILHAVAELTGRHFKVARCIYADIDDSQTMAHITRDYADGVASLAGSHRLEDFGPAIIDDLKAGKTVIVDDVRTDARTGAPEYLAAFTAIQTRALLCVPLVKDGVFVAVLALQDQTPRVWTAEEITLLEQIAERTWFAFENAEAAQALEESEEKFRTLADFIPQLAWMARPDGSMAWYNQRWYNYTGATAETMLDWGWLSALDPKLRPRTEAKFRKAVAEGIAWEDTFPIRRYDGAMRWHLSRAVPIRDEHGQIVRWFGTNTDITEQLEAEARIKRSEAQFRQLADLMPQIVWVTRPDGYHEYYNHGWYDYTGMTEDESVGYEWNAALHPADLASAQERWKHSLKSGEPYEMEYRLRDRNGDYRWFLGRAYPVRDEQGQIVQWFGTCTDIHDRMLLEQELRMAKERAEAANLAKSEFLANISHELRTPMNAVVGLANILKRKQLTPEQQREFLDTMQLSAQQLMELINNLLDVVKLETRNVELESTPFNLHEVVSEIVSINTVKAQEKGIALDVRHPPELAAAELIGDPLRLRQILMNLVSNAVKFTEQGQVVVELDYQPAAQPGWVDVRIAVTDTGIGIPDHKLETIFSKFSQGDTTVTRKYGGSGLGLSIAKTLLELMDGHITVESKPGKGSTFTVHLSLPLNVPEAADPPAAASAGADSPAPPEQAFRVLLVEDYKANIMVAASLLEAFGYPFGLAKTGREALERLEEAHYDLVLMDIQMPEMDGFKATRLIREKEMRLGSPRLPIIGITAHALKGDRDKCLAAGMDDYISKPFQAEELHEILKRFHQRKLQGTAA